MKLDKYVLKTYSPGLVVADPGLDPGFAEELEAHKKGKLRAKHPESPRTNHSPYNFHLIPQWMKDDQIKEECIIRELCVPATLDDGTPNKEGIVLLDTEDQVKLLWKALLKTGERRIKLDLMFGKDISDEAKQEIEKSIPRIYQTKTNLNTKPVSPTK